MRNIQNKTTRNILRNLTLGLTAAAALLTTGAIANAAPQQFHGGGEREAGRGGEFRQNVAPQRGFEQRGFEQRGLQQRSFERREYGRGYGSGFVGGYGGVEVRPHFRAVNEYIPPCPGDGYFWTAGYYEGDVWIPGVWALRGGYARAFGPGFGFERSYGYARGVERGGFNRDYEGHFVNHGFGERHFDNQRAADGGHERGFGGDNHGRR